MALILYKCDTCKRSIGKPQNPKGLEVMGRCVITLGCRGRMYQEDVLEDFVRGELPADIVGLDNWQQRRALYNHTQVKNESTWRIEHNLGTVPVVSVFINAPTIDDDDHQEEVIPQDTIFVSSDVVEIVFSSPHTGIAQLVARSTDPQLFQPTAIVVEEEEVIQVTNGGELTLATRVASPTPINIQVQLMFTTPTGVNVPITYDMNDNPSALSAWAAVNRVLIQGKIFLVRSFNPAVAARLSGIVPSGSTVRVLGFNPDVNFNSISPIGPDQMHILMATEPHQDVDRIKDQVVDTFDLSVVSATKQMVYTDGEMYVTPASIETIHPAIRSI